MPTPIARPGDDDEELENAIVAQYQQAEFWKAYSSVKLNTLFTPDELAGIKALLADMQAAGDDNTRKAAAITRSTQLVAKILKVAKIVV